MGISYVDLASINNNRPPIYNRKTYNFSTFFLLRRHSNCNKFSDEKGST